MAAKKTSTKKTTKATAKRTIPKGVGRPEIMASEPLPESMLDKPKAKKTSAKKTTGKAIGRIKPVKKAVKVTKKK